MLNPLPREGSVTVERHGHVLMIGLDNPDKYNAFDLKMMHDLSAAYGELEENPNLRCGVLFGNGKHFTTGLVFDQWIHRFSDGEFIKVPEGGLDPLKLQKPMLSKPMVVAVHGYCLTIGIELLLACDIRVASSDTHFGQIEVKRGIYPVGGATMRLPREIGWGNAMRYLLTGDSFTAEQAQQMGLIQEVTEPGQQLTKAFEIAETISRQAPLAVSAALASAQLARDAGEDVAASQLIPDLLPLLDSDDVQEGVQSFLERRQANFTGR